MGQERLLDVRHCAFFRHSNGCRGLRSEAEESRNRDPAIFPWNARATGVSTARFIPWGTLSCNRTDCSAGAVPPFRYRIDGRATGGGKHCGARGTVMNDLFGTGYSNSYDLLYSDKDYGVECDLIVRAIGE